MKRMLAALCALCLFLSLASCARDTTGPEDPDTAENPGQSETPEGGETGDETPGTPDDKPDETPDTPDDETPDEPEDPDVPVPAAEISFTDQTGSYSDLVEYTIPTLIVACDHEEAAAIINDYYRRQAQKYLSYVTEEVCFDAEEAGVSATVMVSYAVLYNQGEALSVQRICETELDGELTTSVHSETFRVTDGALLTADALFTCDEATYTDRIVNAVIDLLTESGAEDLLDGWEAAARASFDKNNFVLTETAYHVYYPAGTLFPEALGVDIPYETLADILTLP